MGSNVPQRRGATSSTVQTDTHMHAQEHRNHRCAVCGLSTYALVAWLNKLQYRRHRCVFVWEAKERFLNYSWSGKQHRYWKWYFLWRDYFSPSFFALIWLGNLFQGLRSVTSQYIKELHPGKTLHILNLTFSTFYRINMFLVFMYLNQNHTIWFEIRVIPKSEKGENYLHTTKSLSSQHWCWNKSLINSALFTNCKI